MKIIQSFSQIDKKFSPRMKEFHFTGKPLLKVGVITLGLSVALAGGYVLDVWALGTAAACLHGLGVKFRDLLAGAHLMPGPGKSSPLGSHWGAHA